MLFWRVFGVPVLAALLTFSSVAFAQKKNPQAVERLRTTLESLNLTEDQQAKIKPILVEQGEKVRTARAGASTDKKGAARKVREILAETEGRIKPLLTEEQWTKFQEAQQKAIAEQKAKRKNK